MIPYSLKYKISTLQKSISAWSPYQNFPSVWFYLQGFCSLKRMEYFEKHIHLYNICIFVYSYFNFGNSKLLYWGRNPRFQPHFISNPKLRMRGNAELLDMFHAIRHGGFSLLRNSSGNVSFQKQILAGSRFCYHFFFAICWKFPSKKCELCQLQGSPFFINRVSFANNETQWRC